MSERERERGKKRERESESGRRGEGEKDGEREREKEGIKVTFFFPLKVCIRKADPRSRPSAKTYLRSLVAHGSHDVNFPR